MMGRFVVFFFIWTKCLFCLYKRFSVTDVDFFLEFVTCVYVYGKSFTRVIQKHFALWWLFDWDSTLTRPGNCSYIGSSHFEMGIWYVLMLEMTHSSWVPFRVQSSEISMNWIVELMNGKNKLLWNKSRKYTFYTIYINDLDLKLRKSMFTWIFYNCCQQFQKSVAITCREWLLFRDVFLHTSRILLLWFLECRGNRFLLNVCKYCTIHTYNSCKNCWLLQCRY